MGKKIKAFLYGFISIFDLSGILRKKQLEDIYNNLVIKGFETDKENIARDFDKSIRKIVK